MTGRATTAETTRWADCIVYWTPRGLGDGSAHQLMLGPYPEDRFTALLAGKYLFCNGHFKGLFQASSEDARLAALSMFHVLVARDGLDPAAVHDAFMSITEYRALWEQVSPLCEQIDR
jgi:hypothetical protein